MDKDLEKALLEIEMLKDRVSNLEKKQIQYNFAFMVLLVFITILYSVRLVEWAW